VLTIIFMAIYYRTGGLVADGALVFCLLFLMGVLAAFQGTLTLPGIAGIILTLAVAVDANVLIYERIREEEATGKTLRAAIDAGYEKGVQRNFRFKPDNVHFRRDPVSVRQRPGAGVRPHADDRYCGVHVQRNFHHARVFNILTEQYGSKVTFG